MILPLHAGDWRHVSYLCVSPDSQEAVLVNSGQKIQFLLEELSHKDLSLKGIFLLSGNLSEAARAAELASRFRVEVWAHEDDLLDLNRLPSRGEIAGLCGVKSPMISHHLRTGGCVDIVGTSFKILRNSSGDRKGTLLVSEKEAFVGSLSPEDLLPRIPVGRNIFRTNAPPQVK